MDYVAPMVNKIGIHIEGALMYELQERKVKANREYLKAFRLVSDLVQDFVAKVMQLNSICQDMANKIQSNKAKTQDLLARTAALQNEKKQIAIDDFLSRYSLTPEEETALKGSEVDGTVNAKFFAVLQHVKQIHDDCKQFLRSSGEHLAP
uniref:Conserved oligomeric Golgi complex subunit 6 n=1 Tax=Wuchereria bancrofti TaxID=6293 RepID=A0A1I8EAC6_WUCBA